MSGLTQIKTLAMAALFAAATLGAAQASTVSSTCPDSGTWDRTFTLSSSDSTVTSIDCYAWGAGPAIHESDLNDQLTADGYVYSGTVSDVNPAGDTSGFDDLYSLLGDNGGSFDTTGAYDAVLIFKVGPEACPSQTVPGILCLPAFAAFEISVTGDALLDWATDKCMDGLTHVSIYLKPAAVPVPAAGVMLLGALGALAALMRGKRGRKSAAPVAVA
jgi:hypothetical protein